MRIGVYIIVCDTNLAGYMAKDPKSGLTAPVWVASTAYKAGKGTLKTGNFRFI